jgi:hypothetical protein
VARHRPLGNRERERIKVDSEQAAKDLVRYVNKLELAGTNVIEAIRRARTPEPPPPPATFPCLRDALPAWVERQARAGEIRASTERHYRARLRVWCYPHRLPDGRQLGDVTVDAVTREMLGGLIRRIREAGRDATQLRDVAPGGRHGRAVGAAAARARVDRADGRHLRLPRRC